MTWPATFSLLFSTITPCQLLGFTFLSVKRPAFVLETRHWNMPFPSRGRWNPFQRNRWRRFGIGYLQYMLHLLKWECEKKQGCHRMPQDVTHTNILCTMCIWFSLFSWWQFIISWKLWPERNMYRNMSITCISQHPGMIEKNRVNSSIWLHKTQPQIWYSKKHANHTLFGPEERLIVSHAFFLVARNWRVYHSFHDCAQAMQKTC